MCLELRMSVSLFSLHNFWSFWYLVLCCLFSYLWLVTKTKMKQKKKKNKAKWWNYVFIQFCAHFNAGNNICNILHLVQPPILIKEKHILATLKFSSEKKSSAASSSPSLFLSRAKLLFPQCNLSVREHLIGSMVRASAALLSCTVSSYRYEVFLSFHKCTWFKISKELICNKSLFAIGSLSFPLMLFEVESDFLCLPSHKKVINS